MHAPQGSEPARETGQHTASEIEAEANTEANALSRYEARSGRLEAVWTLEVQTVQDDTDRILDAVLAVHPLGYGRYQRNASISAVGIETARPEPGSTTDSHSSDFEAGAIESFQMVELKISIERDLATLAAVMDTILEVHHYEEPVIFVREDWVSRSNYNPNSNNPNRWWNNGRGLPERIA